VAATPRYVSPPVPLPSPERISASGRAVIEVSGVDLAGPSYEARVFLNNPEAGPDTPMTPDNGYAGSFHVYGYGLPTRSDTTAAGTALEPGIRVPQLPVQRSIFATEAVLRAAAEGPTATVTVVPVVRGVKPGVEIDLGPMLTIDGVAIRTGPGTDGEYGPQAGLEARAALEQEQPWQMV
jgi:hypothetical protein